MLNETNFVSFLSFSMLSSMFFFLFLFTIHNTQSEYDQKELALVRALIQAKVVLRDQILKGIKVKSGRAVIMSFLFTIAK